MSRKETSPIPTVFLDNSVESLVPKEFSKLTLVEKNDLLDGFSHRNIQIPTLRKIVLLNSIVLIQDELKETNPTDNLQIPHKLITIIVPNQIDRSLQPVWEGLLEGKAKTKSENPLTIALLKAGNTKLGMYGLALLPNKENDFTSPSFDVIPQAFSKWLDTIDSSDFNYEIKKLQQTLSSTYSTSDFLKLNNLLIQHLYSNQHSKKRRLFRKKP